MSVSDRPWGEITQADYTPAQWRRACLVDTGVGDPDSKSRYKVPVREPDGTLNRHGAYAAAGGHGLGAVQGISTDDRRRAARALVAMYRDDLGEDPPESLMVMAGESSRSAGAMGMNTTHYRSFRPDLDVKRSGDGRTIYGIAVPYNAPTRIDGNLIEQFARGAFNHQLARPNRVKFAREHVLLGGEIIGAATLLRDDPIGLYVELRAAHTPRGDETLELVKDGALDQLSIMFREGQNRRLAGGVTERVRADLREVAVVMEGAYGELATATGVRSAQIPMAAEDLDLRAAAEEFLGDRAFPDLPDYDLTIRAIRLGMNV